MRRELRPEAMEDPALEHARHRHALRSLARLNRFSGSARLFWPFVLDFARATSHPLRILDLGCGGGDVPLSLWKRARNAGIDLEIHGVDVHPRAVRFARENAERMNAAVRFDLLDALAEPLPGDFDVVLNSLFLHHMTEDEAVLLLTKMRRAARRAVLINDLRRSAHGLALAHVAARMLTTSDVVWFDAPQSVRSSFTPAEVDELARRAGMHGAEVTPRWPQRLLLAWRSA